jgi:cell wall-associated NlpC family hydrolase
VALRTPRFTVVLPVLAFALTGVVATTSPFAAAAPESPVGGSDVVSVEQQLGQLAMTNSLLVDKFDTARVELAGLEQAADAARKAADAAGANYEQARTQLSETVAIQYEGGAFSATGALLSSDSGQQYLDQVQALSMLSTHATQVTKQMSDAKSAADAAAAHAQDLVDQAKARNAALVKERDSVQAQLDKYRSLLGMLDPHAREQFQRTLAPSATGEQLLSAKVRLTLTASAAARKAVNYALAQVGKPYVFGAAGPDSFDCSGLTMMAWAQSGVQLPHSSEVQFTMGTPVPLDQLQPGDLIFFYGNPPAHVTIYAGSGLMVSAPTEGENVSVVPLSAFASDVSGARRFG